MELNLFPQPFSSQWKKVGGMAASRSFSRQSLKNETVFSFALALQHNYGGNATAPLSVPAPKENRSHRPVPLSSLSSRYWGFPAAAAAPGLASSRHHRPLYQAGRLPASGVRGRRLPSSTGWTPTPFSADIDGGCSSPMPHSAPLSFHG